MESNSKSRSPSPASDNSSEKSHISTSSELKSHFKEKERKTDSKKHETPELISNFSVASLLADTKITSPKPTFWKATDWFLSDSSSLSHDSPTLKANDIEDHVPLSETDIFLVDRASRSQLPQRSSHPSIPTTIWTMTGQRPLLQGAQWPLSLHTNNSQSKSFKLLIHCCDI